MSAQSNHSYCFVYPAGVIGGVVIRVGDAIVEYPELRRTKITDWRRPIGSTVAGPTLAQRAFSDYCKRYGI